MQAALNRPTPQLLAQELLRRREAKQGVILRPTVWSGPLVIPDIVDWAEQHFYLGETSKPIVLAPHQKEILRIFSERLPDGSFKWSTCLYSTIKKSGKTTISALYARWAAETWGYGQEVYNMGNKLKQARDRAFLKVRQSIKRSPQHIRDEWEILHDRMTHTPSDSFIEALPVNDGGEAGGNPSLTVWTELWGFDKENARRFWDEMQPVATRELSQRFVDTYAGYTGESELLWELWQLALSGDSLHETLPIYGVPRAGLVAYIDTGVEARRMPWQRGEKGDAYYARVEAHERPVNYQRLHLNLWVNSQTAFMDMALWDSLAVDPDEIRLMATLPVVIAVDAAVSSDTTAIVAVTVYHDKVIELETRIFTPPKGGKLDYALTLKPALIQMFRRYGVVSVPYDMHQLHDFMTQLQKEFPNIPFYAFDQGAERLKADTQLLYRINQRLLRHSGNPQLREHMQNADAKDEKHEKAIRIVKRTAAKKIDGAVGLSMATWHASQLADLAQGEDVFYESFHDRLEW